MRHASALCQRAPRPTGFAKDEGSRRVVRRGGGQKSYYLLPFPYENDPAITSETRDLF